jgi:6-phosphogluconolactonase (cycloisomerase 2 family)
MKLSLFGRWSMALLASLALGLGMTACGGGTVGYMWVLGQEYNQIVGFKIDQYSGNLTEIPGAPFSSHGAVPVSLVVKSGGQYVYVINQGTCPTTGCGTGPNSSAGVELFSVGGDGVLTFQQEYPTQGYDSQWAQMDSSGTYLYVLDKYSPDGSVSASGVPNGAITAFKADPTNGRLSLVTNTQVTLQNGLNPTYFDVGPAPFMMKSQAGCLYTVNAGTTNGFQTVSPYSVGTSGVLTLTTNQSIPINLITSTPTNITSINGSGSDVFLTDAANNVIYGYQTGGTCNLTALGGGITQNLTGTSNPTYTFLDSTGKYLYVANSSTTTTTIQTPFSSLSAFSINSAANNELQALPGAPYTIGSGPVCIVEDPTNQYLYTSNHNDGTITGKVLNPTTGELSQLTKGSTFTASGLAGCLVVSGTIN